MTEAAQAKGLAEARVAPRSFQSRLLRLIQVKNLSINHLRGSTANPVWSDAVS